MTIPAGAVDRKQAQQRAQQALERAEAETLATTDPWLLQAAQDREARALRKAVALYRSGR